MNAPTLGGVLRYRFETGFETGGSGRLDLWKTAWEGFQKSIIWGNGGKYVLRKAGNYAHNDYLEILSSHGLIGFVAMAFLYLYILIFIKRNYKGISRNSLSRVQQ